MARIKPTATAAAERRVQDTLDRVDQAFGQRLAPARIQTRCLPILEASARLGAAPAASGLLPAAVRWLVVLRAAELIGDPFCVHARLGRATTGDPAKLRSIGSFRSSELFTPAERTALALAEAMTQTPAGVSDAVYSEARQHFDDAQLVELAATIAMENYRARFNWAFAIQPEDAVAGTDEPVREAVRTDRVMEASMESFPASDAPGWIADQL